MYNVICKIIIFWMFLQIHKGLQKGFKNQSPNMLKCLRVPAIVYKLPTETGNICEFLFLHIYFYIYIIYMYCRPILIHVQEIFGRFARVQMSQIFFTANPISNVSSHFLLIFQKIYILNPEIIHCKPDYVWEIAK